MRLADAVASPDPLGVRHRARSKHLEEAPRQALFTTPKKSRKPKSRVSQSGSRGSSSRRLLSSVHRRSALSTWLRELSDWREPAHSAIALGLQLVFWRMLREDVTFVAAVCYLVAVVLMGAVCFAVLLYGYAHHAHRDVPLVIAPPSSLEARFLQQPSVLLTSAAELPSAQLPPVPHISESEMRLIVAEATRFVNEILRAVHSAMFLGEYKHAMKLASKLLLMAQVARFYHSADAVLLLVGYGMIWRPLRQRYPEKCQIVTRVLQEVQQLLKQRCQQLLLSARTRTNSSAAAGSVDAVTPTRPRRNAAVNNNNNNNNNNSSKKNNKNADESARRKTGTVRVLQADDPLLGDGDPLRSSVSPSASTVFSSSFGTATTTGGGTHSARSSVDPLSGLPLSQLDPS